MRGHLVKRSRTSWSIVIPLGNDPETGRRRQKWVSVRGTKKAADAELARLLAELDRGISPATGKVTVREYLETWLRDVVAQRNRPRTVQSYAAIVRHHLNPVLGNIMLHKLQPADVDRMIATIRAKGRTANTALHVFTVLRKALRDAERRGLVNRNVCRLVDAPKIEPYRVDPPSMATVARVLAEADGTEYGPILHFMARTGIRRGEAVALRWENLDLDRSVAAIIESAQRLPGQGIVFQPTKSLAGRRGIALDPGTVAMMRHHRARQTEHILSLGGVYEAADIVFAGPLGRPLDLDRLSHGFKAIAKRAGFPNVRLHDPRHAHAAGMVRAGIHPRVVQERLGHTSAAFTMQVYGHVAAGLQTDAADAFASLLAEASR